MTAFYCRLSDDICFYVLCTKKECFRSRGGSSKSLSNPNEHPLNICRDSSRIPMFYKSYLTLTESFISVPIHSQKDNEVIRY